MSTTVLPQLREIESELAAQEKDLSAQLQEIQSKLNGIRAVLPMFDEDGELTDAVSAPSSSTPASTQTEEEETTSSEPEASELTSSKAKKTTTKAKTSKKKSKKKDGRAADWQKYTRPGVKNQSIPEAVKLILATQPDKEFKIAEVMEALFKDMPKSQYLKARNRVSNVLSGGVRAGDWHRGERSTYRMNAS